MIKSSKISMLLIAFLLSAGAMAQSAPESNGGDTAKSNAVNPANPGAAQKMDTANSKMSKTDANTSPMKKPKKAKKAKAADSTMSDSPTKTP